MASDDFKDLVASLEWGVTLPLTRFAILLMFAALWFLLDRDSLDWHAVATLATLFMTLVIQRAEHRDTQALQGKLDELLRVHGEARNELTRLDEREPEDIEKWRARETKE